MLRPANIPLHQNLYLTGINWLDALLGIPGGFFVGFALYFVGGIIVEAICGLPSHRPQMLASSSIGAVSTLIMHIMIGRKYSLLAFTMCLGSIPLYLLMFFLAWCLP